MPNNKKINYNLIFNNTIKNFGLKSKPSLLLHCCCAPCSCAVLNKLSSLFNITLYYYNPNIYPNSEYLKRACEFNKLNLTNIKLIKTRYNHNSFLSCIKNLHNAPEGGARCYSCFKLRLENSFKYASKHGFDFITTTLTISPHKNEQIVNEIGKTLQEKYKKTNFLFADFKKEDGYKNSIKLSNELNLYRQNYCGCEFSLNESCN